MDSPFYISINQVDNLFFGVLKLFVFWSKMKTMKKFLVFVYLLLIYTTINAQKCAYISNIVSGMDGTLQVITEPASFSRSKNNGELQVWSKLHQDTSVVLALTINTPRVSEINEIDHIRISLENKEEILLQLMNNVDPSKRKVEKFSIYAVISTSNQELLFASPVVEVSVNSKGGKTLSYIAKSKRESDLIKKVLTCVIEAMPDPD